MRKTMLAALAVLAGACSGNDDGGGGGPAPMQYAAAQPPNGSELAAAATATTTLEGTVTFAPVYDPGTGAPGLADQLAADLGGETMTLTVPAGAAKLGAGPVARAVEAEAISPGLCIEMTATSVTWNGCTETVTITDGFETITASITPVGTMTWNDATGATTWDIRQTVAMTGTQFGEPLSLESAAHSVGTLTTTASTISGSAQSTMTASGSYMGFPMDQGVQTSLTLQLGYEQVPFCITSGALTLEQRYTRRPAGATPLDLPDQGWRFEWSGCGLFTVAHGT